MKILVLAASYPKPDGSVTLQYIHSRNLQYVAQGIDVSVISFDAETDYELDQVKVYTLQTYKMTVKHERFDLLVSHAPNIRQHYQFIHKYGGLYPQFVFFFHGHEVLNTTKTYPEPYYYMETSRLKTLIKYLYNQFKLRFWRYYFKKVAHKSHFVFVSEWMYHKFLESVKIDQTFVQDRMSIIYNCIGELFETNHYDWQTPKPYDFITIRNNLDGSKYAIDIVTDIAKSHPQYQFCVIGQGDFYHYNDKPSNLEWIDTVLAHDDIIGWLNQARCALIPTRLDSQGVMACEIATFGMPLITSDIDVCTEVFSGFPNVDYIKNNAANHNVQSLLESIESGLPYDKKTNYFARNTIMQEVQLFHSLTQ